MNMFAMGHGLHSAVRQEVGKFLYPCYNHQLFRLMHLHYHTLIFSSSCQ